MITLAFKEKTQKCQTNTEKVGAKAKHFALLM